MDMAGMVKMVASRLGNRTDLDTIIADEIRRHQELLSLEPELPWFLVQLDVTLGTTVVGDANVAYPVGFLSLLEDERTLWLVDANGGKTFLPKLLPSDIGETSMALPEGFLESPTGIVLYPTPDAAYTVHAAGYVADVPIPETGENLWSKHAFDVLTASAGIDLAVAFDAAGAVKLFSDRLAAAKLRLQAKTVSWSETALSRNTTPEI